MAEVYIYDEIGPDWMGLVSARSVIEQIEKAGKSRIELRINSPGGSVWEATSMMAKLRAHKAGVDVYIDGLAASAASLVAMVGESITMAQGSMMMVHRAINLTYGNVADHEKAIEVLKKYDSEIVDIYADRTKLPREEVQAMLDAETWLSPSEAVAKGFATAATGASGIKVCAIKEGRYRNTPAALLARELPREHDRRVREQQAAVSLRLTRARIGR